jgi:hypothetical protein
LRCHGNRNRLEFQKNLGHLDAGRPFRADKVDEAGGQLPFNKDIEGTIMIEERAEQAELQRRAVAYRDRVAPLLIEGAKRYHGQLLEMKRQREGS